MSDDKTEGLFKKQQENPPADPTTRAAFDSLNQKAQTAVQQMRAQNLSAGENGVQQVSEQAYNHVPNAKQPEPNQLARGLSKEGTVPPPPSPTDARVQQDASASMNEGKQAGTQQDASKVQQTSVTMGESGREMERSTGLAGKFGGSLTDKQIQDALAKAQEAKQHGTERDDR